MQEAQYIAPKAPSPLELDATETSIQPREYPSRSSADNSKGNVLDYPKELVEIAKTLLSLKEKPVVFAESRTQPSQGRRLRSGKIIRSDK